MQGKNVVQVGLIFAAFSFLASFGLDHASRQRRWNASPRLLSSTDWSTLYSTRNQGLLPDLHLVESDPRAFFSWRTRTSESEGREIASATASPAAAPTALPVRAGLEHLSWYGGYRACDVSCKIQLRCDAKTKLCERLHRLSRGGQRQRQPTKYRRAQQSL